MISTKLSCLSKQGLTLVKISNLRTLFYYNYSTVNYSSSGLVIY